MAGIAPIAVIDALLLRTQMPELVLRPGTSVVARVASRLEGQPFGVLVLAGVPLTAQLPDDVAAGETLRLTVSEVTPENVTMRMEPQAAPTVALGPPAPPPPEVTVQEPPQRRTGEDGGEAHSVALAFASVALGTLDLRLELTPAGISASVTAPAGQAHELAEASAGALRDGLTARTGLPAGVRVVPRRPPLDLYA